MRPCPEEPIQRFIPYDSHINNVGAESVSAILLAFDREDELQLSHRGEAPALFLGEMRVVLHRGLNDESRFTQ